MNCRFKICSDWSKFRIELKDVFKKNRYPENIVNNCFKMFLFNKHSDKKNILKMQEKPLILVFSKVQTNVQQLFHCEKYRNFTWFPVWKSGEITVFFAVFVLHIVSPESLFLVLFINFSVDTAMNLIMIKIRKTPPCKGWVVYRWISLKLVEFHHWWWKGVKPKPS